MHLYTCEYFPKYGGIATYCHELAAAAQRRGLDAWVLAPRGARKAATDPNGYHLEAADWAANHGLRARWQIRRRLQKDLYPPPAYTLFPEPGPILALGSLPAALTHPARPILILHGSEIQRWQQNPLARWLARRAMAAAQKVIAVSTPVAELAETAFPEAADKVHAVANALPSDYANLQETAKPRSGPDAPCRILSVGRFHPRKGFDQVLQALAKLPREARARVRYTIAGGRKSADYLRALQGFAREHEIDLHCEVDASPEVMQAAYREAHIFVLTSVPTGASIEGFGLVYLEAGAYGLPCLAYDNGGVRDAVRQGETGFLVPTGDIDALADRLARWIQHPKEAAAMGQTNQRFARSRTWDDVLEAILKTT